MAWELMGKRRTSRILELGAEMRGTLNAAHMAKKEMGGRKFMKMTTAMRFAILVSVMYVMLHSLRLH